MATAVVTGGTGGLGRVLAATLKSRGFKVEAPGSADLDVTDRSAVERFFSSMDVPDLLVCAAGITRDRLMARMDESAWDEVVAANLRGAFLCARAVVAGMAKRRSGHIVFISSHSALRPPVGQAAYAAAKAGLLGLTKALAKEVGGRGVRVNAILPGFLETRMTADLDPALVARARQQHALDRFNTVEEVAAFLRCLHEDMKGTSGQAFALDSRIL